MTSLHELFLNSNRYRMCLSYTLIEITSGVPWTSSSIAR